RSPGNVVVSLSTFPAVSRTGGEADRLAERLLTQDPLSTHVLLLASPDAADQALIILGRLKELRTFRVGPPTAIWPSDGVRPADVLPLADTASNATLLAHTQGIAPLGLARESNRLAFQAADFQANMLAQRGIEIAPASGGYDVYLGYTYDAVYALAA